MCRGQYVKAKGLLVNFKVAGDVSAGDIFFAFIWEGEEGEMIFLHNQTRAKLAAQLYVLYAFGVLVSRDSYRERQTLPIELNFSTTSVGIPKFSKRAATDKPH
jgi:hypothetical protein